MELTWAAGLFEGEGAVTVCNGRRRLALKMISEESVRRFAAAIGVGRVYGPYKNRSRDRHPRSPFFYWMAEDAEAERAVELLFPLVSEWRRVAMYETFSDIVGDAPAHLRVQVRAIAA